MEQVVVTSSKCYVRNTLSFMSYLARKSHAERKCECVYAKRIDRYYCCPTTLGKVMQIQAPSMTLWSVDVASSSYVDI